MLVIEVQLSQQEERKKIEWRYKNGDPTFEELKHRIQQCGVPDDWCVEVLRGNIFVCPDLEAPIHGPKITVRVSPVSDLGGEGENHDDRQWTRWMRTAFEKVVSHVGRLYLVDTAEDDDDDAGCGECCVGTATLMDVHGECICALHCIDPAVADPDRYKIYAVFPNYQTGCFRFEAKPRAIDEVIDVCVIEPMQPLKKPYLPTSYLDLATDVREDDRLYCFFFPQDPLKHVTPHELQELLSGGEKNSPLRGGGGGAGGRSLDHPSIAPGTVCFSQWMQGVAAYEHPPDCNGGILVSRSGRVKGMHVRASTCGELRSTMGSEDSDELRIARKVCKNLSTYAPSDAVPVFVPPHGLVKLLGLEGGCELLHAAIRQNKVPSKLNAPNHPPTPPKSTTPPPPKRRKSTKRSRSTAKTKHNRHKH